MDLGDDRLWWNWWEIGDDRMVVVMKAMRKMEVVGCRRRWICAADFLSVIHVSDFEGLAIGGFKLLDGV